MTFSAEAADLVPGDDNGTEDVFLRARGGGVKLVTKIQDGSPAENGGYDSAVDGPARRVAFSSSSTDFVDDDDNEQQDVFMYRRP